MAIDISSYGAYKLYRLPSMARKHGKLTGLIGMLVGDPIGGEAKGESYTNPIKAEIEEQSSYVCRSKLS